MKRIILTSGPRGAGKSTYVRNFLEKNPRVKGISRDDLLIELFGKTSLNPYTGGHEYAYRIFFNRIKNSLNNASDLDLIVDCWNGYPKGRKDMVEQFKDYGADRILCWKFITPLDVCLNWFFKKEDSRSYSKSGIERDYELYHEKSKNISKENFDNVYLINPLQLEFPLKLN
ncbi:AAA family ATPase [Candidatus Woesearchaeota archaeon]|jgi:predicted kinase|nr:AAA family ATPase [Candidatus Woesearchaeota archaeon]